MKTANIVNLDGEILEYHTVTDFKRIQFIKENAQRIASQGISCYIEWYDHCGELCGSDFYFEIQKAI